MKKIMIFLVILMQCFFIAANGDSFEPKILITEVEAPVMLYFTNIDVGFTSVKANVFQDYLIKSLNLILKKQFQVFQSHWNPRNSKPFVE